MPKVLLLHGFSFFFFANEGSEPPHVHVSKADADAKFWLQPTIELEYFDGFSPRELKFIRETINDNYEYFMEKWNEFITNRG